MDACVTRFRDSLTVVRYHMSWPGSDPWYTANSTENDQRRAYYTVNYVPYCKIDGAWISTNYMADIRARTRAPTPLTVRLSGSYNRTTRTGTLNARVTNTGATSYTGAIQFLIVDDSTMYSSYYQNQAMRDMIPNGNGETFTLAASDSVLKTRNFTISTSWRQDSCKAVVFVQDGHAQGDTMRQGADLRVRAMTSIEEEGSGVYPQNISLTLRSANPFSRFVDIGYALPMDEKVSLKVYNSSGRLVTALVDGNVVHGYHTTRFDGAGLPNGVYVLMLRDRDSKLTQKITLVK